MEKKVRVHIAFKFCLCFVTCPMPAGGSKYCRILRIKRYRLQQRLCPLSVFSFCSCLHFFAERVREHLKSPSILMAYKFILLFKVIGLKKKFLEGLLTHQSTPLLLKSWKIGLIYFIAASSQSHSMLKWLKNSANT